MSAEQDQARRLAERIARRIAENSAKTQASPSRADGGQDVGQELSVMRASLEELQHRLARIESHVAPGDERKAVGATEQPRQAAASASSSPQAASHSPWLSGMYVPAAAAHPSEERFGIEEAAVSELVDFFEGEKKCELEPGGKPCDHCAMCSTRGF